MSTPRPSEPLIPAPIAAPRVLASKSLRDRLTRFLRAVQSHRAAPARDAHRVFHRGSHVIALREDEYADYRRLVGQLLHEFGANDAISVGTAESHLDDGVFLARSPLALDDGRRAAFAASHVLDALGRPICEWLANFQVVGFYDDCLPFQLGRAQFFPRGTSLWPMVAPTTPPKTPFLRSFRQYVQRDIEEHFGGNEQWAQLRVAALEGDTEAARALALADLELTIDVLNFYGDIVRPAAYMSRIEMADRAADGVCKSCVVMQGKEPGGVATAITRPLDDMWVPDLASAEAKEIGLARVHGILSKPHADRTRVERRVLAALRWGGRASVAREPPDRLILFMTALEALVNDDTKRAGVAVTVETRAVQLLNNDNSAAARDADLQRLYDARSRLVHSGWADVSSADVWAARCWAKECTVRVLTGPLVDQAEEGFNSWFRPPSDGQPG